MRLAVISDIHGECFALEQVLKDIRRQGFEKMVCLGDAVQEGSQPAETVARLLTGMSAEGEETSEQQRAVREWSLAQLSESDLAFIQQFEPTLGVALEGGKTLLCFHGSPRSFDEIILPETADEVVRQYLGGYKATLFTGGHTHTQQMRRLGDSWYFNPGSVSLAYNWELSDFAHRRMWVDPWADYAIVSSEGARLGITFRHVPFDVDKLARIVRASGKPYAEEAIAVYLRES